MSRSRGVRSAFVSLLAIAALFGVMGLTSQADAATTVVKIHARVCPSSGVYDYFKDCHSHPVADAGFRVDGSGTLYSNSRGNIQFNNVAAGSPVVALTSGDITGYKLRAFCIDPTGTSSKEYKVRYTSQPSFRITIASGQHITCDVYWIPTAS